MDKSGAKKEPESKINNFGSATLQLTVVHYRLHQIKSSLQLANHSQSVKLISELKYQKQTKVSLRPKKHAVSGYFLCGFPSSEYSDLGHSSGLGQSVCLREEKGNVQNEDADQTNQSNTDHYAHWRRQGGGGGQGGVMISVPYKQVRIFNKKAPRPLTNVYFGRT